LLQSQKNIADKLNILVLHASQKAKRPHAFLSVTKKPSVVPGTHKEGNVVN